MKPRSFLPLDVITIDFETSGFQFDPGARVFSFSLTWCDGTGYTEIWYKGDAVYFANGDSEIVDKIPCPEKLWFDRVNSFWESPCSAVAHNLKFEWHFTKYIEQFAVNDKKQLHDTMIMHQYIDNLCKSHTLDYLCHRYNGRCKEWQEADRAVSKAAKIYHTYDKIPKDLMIPYQICDGHRGALLYEVFWPLVKPKDEYFNEIELIKTTAAMERRGFHIHKAESEKLLSWLKKELEAANKDSKRILKGKYVDLLSEPQVKKLLYTDLKLPKQDTIDKNAIEELRKISDHPILDCIQKTRAYTKGLAIINGYLESAKVDGATHPNIWTNKAGTGRESSENPNMQNVSNEFRANVRYTVPARRCFGPRPRFLLMPVDYAGIEMRLAIQGTGDPRLYKLCEEDFDFHDAYAKTFYGNKYTNEPDKNIKKAMRSLAKNARFAMMYGSGLENTALTLGLSIEETSAGYSRDKEDFPEFYALMDRCTRTARKTGSITTFFGRSLRVPYDRPYAATDYLIQGSAAALFKHAQNKVHHFFENELGDKAFLIIPVHDEIVIEVRRDVPLEPFAREVKRLMLDQPQIEVKLNVEFSIATTTWDKKYERSY